MQSVLLTGAGGGIGRAVLNALVAGDAHRVIAVTRPRAPADSQEPLEGRNCVIQKAVDLSSYSAIATLEAYVADSKLKLDWLVIAHGYIDDVTVLEDQPPEKILATFQLNILAVIYICQLFLGHLEESGGVICVSSTAGLIANGRYAAYSASKAAVNNFMQALARNRPKLSFFTVCPGPTRTRMLKKIRGDNAAGQDASAVGDVIVEIMSRQGIYKSGDIIVVRDCLTTLVGRL